MYYYAPMSPYPPHVHAQQSANWSQQHHPTPPPYSNWSSTMNPSQVQLKDYGRQPLVMNILEAAEKNKNFRTALWTGKHLQVTLMSIPVGGEVGLEIHPKTDQMLQIAEGQGITQIGDDKNRLNMYQVYEGDAVIIPAGKWHNLINNGHRPIKLYSIYAPPNHPFGTVHRTKADSDAADY